MALTPTSETPEAQTFRQCFSDLASTIQDPIGIANKLYSNAIVQSNVKQHMTVLGLPLPQRNTVLLSAVECQIKNDPKKFHSVLKIFSEEPCLDQLTAKLTEIYGMLCGSGKVTESPQEEQTPLKKPKLDTSTTPADIPREIQTLRSRLIGSYKQHSPPCATEWPISDNFAFVQPTLTSLLGDCSDEPPVVEIKDIFSTEGQRKLTLLEGEAGSGKSTLMWHLQHKWATGELFQDFHIMLHASLRDPRVQLATSLADIIPHPSAKVRQAIADYIEEKDGEGVAFLLDGWDQMPQKVLQRQSLIHDLLDPDRLKGLVGASIIVTSRAHATSTLQPISGAHLKLESFSKAQIKQFFETNLREGAALQHIRTVLKTNPKILALCSSPLNAAILALIRTWSPLSAEPLPETRSELYTVLIRNLILRYMERQLQEKHYKRSDKQFRDFPPHILKILTSISSLAFTGILQGKTIFDQSDLDANGVEDETHSLGLLLSREVLTPLGRSYQYHFLHQSVMEFVAAFHIITLPSDSRLLASNLLLETNPTSLVLPFFAGMCGVECHIVIEMVGKVAKDTVSKQVSMGILAWPENDHQMAKLVSQNYWSLWTLFNCIFEAKSAPKGLWNFLYGRVGQLTFQYSRLRLDPMDCAAIGFCMKKAIQEVYSPLQQSGKPQVTVILDRLIDVTFAYCKVHEIGLPLLVEYLYSFRRELGIKLLRDKDLEALSKIPVFLNHPLALRFVRCGIGYEGIHSICKLVSNCALIHTLDLGANWDASEADRNPSVALKYLIEALCRNQTVLKVDLCRNGMGKEHTWHLVLLLTCCKNLHCIGFSWNRIGTGMSILARAFQLNSNLQQIGLMGCCIKDKELNALGVNLAGRKSLNMINVASNLYSNAQFVQFILLLQQVAIEKIHHSQKLSNEEVQIIDDINRSRVYHGMPSFSLHFIPNLSNLVHSESGDNVFYAYPRKDNGENTTHAVTLSHLNVPY